MKTIVMIIILLFSAICCIPVADSQSGSDLVVVDQVDTQPSTWVPSTTSMKIIYNYSVVKYPDVICDVKVKIYDSDNNPVRLINAGRQSQGKHTVTWDGRDSHGTPVIGGTYKVKVEVTFTTYNYALQWGSFGSGDNQFRFPQFVAIGPDGSVYVLDTSDECIKKFGSNGQFIYRLGGHGNADGKFDNPTGMACDGNGNLYVGDWGNFRVQKFNSNGEFVTKWGQNGTHDGEFGRIVGIAVDRNDNVYVNDGRVQVFNRNGGFLRKFSSQGSGDDRFSAIVVSKNDIVYLLATGNCIQTLSLNGDLIKNMDIGSGQLYIAIGPDNDIYLTDTSGSSIKKYDPEGNLLTRWGRFGDGNGQFKSPRGLAIDSNGNAYVSDTDNRRIQKFTPDDLVGSKMTSIEVKRGSSLSPSASAATAGPTTPGSSVTAEPSGGEFPEPSASAFEGPTATPAAGEPTITEPDVSAMAAPSGTAISSSPGGDTNIYLIGGLVIVVIVLVLAVGLMGGYIFGKKK